MAVLSIIDENFFLNSKTNYKFGVLDNDGNYYWFFYGKVVAKNRLDALKYYNALLTYCKNNSLGKPFAFLRIFDDNTERLECIFSADR